MADKYILDGHTPVLCNNVSKWWGLFDDTESRQVARTKLSNGWWVSTVFLGLDHALGNGPPILFETMVFDRGSRPSEKGCERYSTWEAAEVGHWRMVEEVVARTGAEVAPDAV